MRRAVLPALKHGIRNLKHLNPSGKFPSGNVRYYYRPKGKKGIAMPDLPLDHPLFLAAYAVASGQVPKVVTRAGSIAAAVVAFKASATFAALAVSTKAQRRPHLDRIQESYGAGRLADLRTEHILRDLNQLRGHPRNTCLKAWKAMLSWATDEARLITVNPAAALKKAKIAKSDGHIPWDPDQIAKFRDFWPIGSPERLAFELIFWTGSRISDAVRLGPGSEDSDGYLSYRQQKTGGEAIVPFRCRLPDFAADLASDLAMLHDSLNAMKSRHMTFIVTMRGASRSQKSVSQWFAEKARKAGIVGRTAHGLRKSRTIALIEAEATTHQISAWTGHESLSEIQHYGKKFGKRKALSGTKAEQKSSNILEEVPKEAKSK